MRATRVAVTIPVALLALSGCSGGVGSNSGGSVPATVAASPTATGVVTPVTPTPTHAVVTATLGADTPGAGTSRPTAVRPPATADSQQQRIVALQTEGGVPSLVIRLTATGTVPEVPTSTLPVGQTLRMIVVSPVATHLIGKGLGVDLDLPAGDPVAIDVVTFTPGSYMVTTATGGTVARFLMAS